MKRGLILSMVFILSTVLFCFIKGNYNVSASDKKLYLTIGGADSSDYDVDSVQEWSNNQYNKESNNGVPISSSVINNGVCVAFGASDVGNYNTYYGNQTYYIEDVNSYTAQRITYNGSPYDIKYPCGFINYYPQNVEIPAGYTTVGGNYNRTIIYPDTSNGALGVIFTAFICPANTGKKLLVCTDYNSHSVVNPLTTNGITYNDWYWQNGYSAGIMIAHPPGNDYSNFGVNSYWIMEDVPVPIFCDLYDALEYSCSGRILYPEHVLAGADSAVVTPTPTPTATPTPSPLPTQIPYPTSISIDNWPTPVPTATPTPTPTMIPVNVDGESGDGGYNGVSSPDSMDGEDLSELNEKIKESVELTDGFGGLQYPLSEIPAYQSDGSTGVFRRYPYNATTFLYKGDSNDSENGTFLKFLIQSYKVFGEVAYTSNGSFLSVRSISSPLFWILSGLVLVVFITVLKKIL